MNFEGKLIGKDLKVESWLIRLMILSLEDYLEGKKIL